MPGGACCHQFFCLNRCESAGPCLPAPDKLMRRVCSYLLVSLLPHLNLINTLALAQSTRTRRRQARLSALPAPRRTCRLLPAKQSRLSQRAARGRRRARRGAPRPVRPRRPRRPRRRQPSRAPAGAATNHVQDAGQYSRCPRFNVREGKMDAGRCLHYLVAQFLLCPGLRHTRHTQYELIWLACARLQSLRQ